MPDTIILMERTTAGLTVGLVWSPESQEVILEALLGDGEEWHIATAVPGDKALDAFHHPFTYVNPPKEWTR